MSKSDETVKVVVRVRPMSAEEIRQGHTVATEAFPDRCLISLRNPKGSDGDPPKDFYFDAVFGPDVEQKYIYDVCAASVVESCLNGYNGTIFAYGQTGSGKTHTMEGRPDPPSLRGIIPNSFQHIFEYVGATSNVQFLVRASYLEIYNEEIRDLLSKDPKNSLDVKENVETGVYVKDLTSFVVKNVQEIDHVMQAGKKNRSVGATLMNSTSSRSHSIFTIVIEAADNGGEHIRVGKLNLVDLAGSERQGKTGATGDRLKEANKINMSLTVLGNVIMALVDTRVTHIPYRDSKLTRLLQNSLGGNAKTVMCANCGPADYNYDETLSTLRYANRAKNIKNKPRINEDPKDAMLRDYQDQIKALKAQLAATQRGMMVDEQGNEVPVTNARREIVEKIVEREIVKEVRVGISEEEMDQIRRKAEEEKKHLMQQAAQDMRQLIDQQSRTVAERQELQAALDREAEDRRRMETQQRSLTDKLRAMEEKLIKGGEVISKVNQQEARLRQAESELRQRREQEAALARELAEKEELNLQLEEHFSSLQEEVEVKTKKLKKLWTKYQAAVREAKDLSEEFNRERGDLLDTVRQLTQTLKLKELVIAQFIPDDVARAIEKRAVYNQEDDVWTVPRMDLTGNALRAPVGRPVAGKNGKRPESDFARQRKQFDANPRYRGENILSLDLDPADRTTQEYSGPQMRSKLDGVLGMDLQSSVLGDDGGAGPASAHDEVVFDGMQAQYLSYGPSGGAPASAAATAAAADRDDERGARPKTGKKRASQQAQQQQQQQQAQPQEEYYGGNNGASAGAAGGRPRSAARRRTGDRDTAAYDDDRAYRK